MTERIRLAHLPTPIEPLKRLSSILGGPELFIKRDDLTGLGMGGNKTRKLEYLLSDAVQHSCRTLVSTGAVQSNHCRQVAAAAAYAGMECVLVLAGEKPQSPQGNLFLDQLSGARIHFVPKQRRDQALKDEFDRLMLNGKKPYLIPYGGSNAIGSLGYFHAMRELAQQKLEPDWIVFATSSGGTQAGFMLGSKEIQFDGKILGISVDKKAYDFKPLVAEVANAGAELLGKDWHFSLDDVLVDDHYCESGYGVMTNSEIEAIKLFASQQGILLDPVYTGRAAAGLIDLILNRNFFAKGDKVLFWHTGGTPALFAEPYITKLS